MSSNSWWFVIGACAASFVTWRVRRFALTHRILDVPNRRSSHVHPTPRCGGLGIVVALQLGLLVLWLNATIDSRTVLALTLPGLLVAWIGFIDDRRGVSALHRLCVHVIASAFVLWLVTQQPGAHPIFARIPDWLTFVLLLLGIVWSTNLFNFMDGIDGIAGSQALFVTFSAAVLIAVQGGPESWVAIALLASGASLGFLVWNWPPAKIFMGDVGSGFLGFWLSVFGLALHSAGVLAIWASIVLASVFIADATVTLVVRLTRRERIYEAHRSHCYQNLARRLNSHAKVSGLVWLINITVVFPAAYAATVREHLGPWLAGGTIAVLACACLWQGAGTEVK